MGIWAEFYQTLAKNDRQGCQNCIPGVERKVFETLSCEKSLLLLVWILLEKTAKFPQINVVRVVATAVYLSKKTVRRKTSLFFGKYNFFKQFWFVSQFFWIFGKQKIRSSSKLQSTCPKKQLEEKSFSWNVFFWIYFGFLSKKESDCCKKRYGKMVKTAI